MSDRSCCRVRVFLDYWNYELSMRTAEKRFKTDWGKIGPVLVEAAAKIVKSARPTEFQGLNFYGSYGLTEKEGRFNQWATNFVNTQPGVSVHMVRRQKKRAHPKCPMCHYSIKICPKCKADTRGTGEKGIDVRMATDMVKLAWEDNYDVAVLVSSDEDFVPVAEFLEDRGIKVGTSAIRMKTVFLELPLSIQETMNTKAIFFTRPCSWERTGLLMRLRRRSPQRRFMSTSPMLAGRSSVQRRESVDRLMTCGNRVSGATWIIFNTSVFFTVGFHGASHRPGSKPFGFHGHQCRIASPTCLHAG